MILKTVVSLKASVKGAGQNEKRGERIARMERFWKDGVNGVLIAVGTLLGYKVDDKTLAEYIASGEDVTLTEVNVEGVILPLADGGLTLNLANMPSTWGCPACRSAHGSGTYPSREVSAKLLSNNRFFYRPADRALFVISESCWSEYVVGMGAHTPARFRSARSIPKQVTAPAKQEAPKGGKA